MKNGRGALICLLTGGPLHEIKVGASVILFELHRYCGPMPLDKRTLESRNLGPRAPFWRAVSLWAQQGKKTEAGSRDDVRRCIWVDGPLVTFSC